MINTLWKSNGNFSFHGESQNVKLHVIGNWLVDSHTSVLYALHIKFFGQTYLLLLFCLVYYKTVLKIFNSVNVWLEKNNK